MGLAWVKVAVARWVNAQRSIVGSQTLRELSSIPGVRHGLNRMVTMGAPQSRNPAPHP